MGKECDNIKISPPKETLKDYGGTLTINQFRRNGCMIKEYSICVPPMVPIIPVVEESNGIAIKNKRKTKMDYLNKLNIKRSNPLPNSKYNLMRSMGLKKKKG